ncbi:MAG: beta-ketoacyl-[acyl-carrier-protein] synthase family protein, partial [Deltaproteobacteria bacterium]|nr:beta-ketoacyl-[acyl-carrier-protein] synthase family protein [Deltaproteobacteria bacterium]
PIFTTTTACSSSATAIGIGADIILEGIADIMITGGSDSLCELTFGGFNSLRAMDPVTCRPFDKDRAGMVLGEGAAILVLESEQSALSRDAPILGEFLGYAMVGEAYHITAPEETGELQSYVMELALKDANISKDEIDLINAHGTGTPHNDLVETVAIKKLFGKKAYNIPVTANKSMIGHCLGSAGAVEAAASLISILEGFIPPTINIKNLDPKCDLDYVTEGARIKNINYVLSNSFAFGGNLTSLIIGKRA